ncbi:hypothetical protein WSM22_44170 [Cytophagales bacterium WSM2-2]|nr:hypothetical protein WSM22_44170 [Cytophagales bacterium WSM2-2]
MTSYFDILRDITFSGATFKDFRDSFCLIREDGKRKIVTMVRFVPFSTGINSYTQYGDSTRHEYPSAKSDETILEDLISKTYSQEKNYKREDYTIKPIELF